MSKEKLVKETEIFFMRHWQEQSIGTSPEWSEAWEFVGSIQHGENVGCYALFSNEKLLYIGVAESGLGSRTNHYTRVSPTQTPGEIRKYEPAPDWKSKQLTHMCTIGFPDEYWYLPAALEKYLIRRLNPPENVNGK
ncbi:MAG: hypothetical protein NTW90_00415 [Nitrosospira sp.]|nr:hypothetical protein [Nitrosospira sp.]